MAQAGFHGMVGVAVRKWMPRREWLMLGIVLGNLLPDADNLAVAVATLTGGSTEGLHRTFTHSLFTVASIVILFYIIALLGKNKRWSNLGWGLGIGVFLHILLDLLVWFDGVEILWPLGSRVNFWLNVVLPDWWDRLMLPLENAALALFFVLLASLARKQATNQDFLGKLKIWTWVQAALAVLFLVLVFSMESGYMTIFGAVYLLSLFLAAWITCRMRKTIEVNS